MSGILNFIEQLRGWVSTSLLGVIAWVVVKGMAMMLKNQIENRVQTAAERKQEREGYGPLIAALQADVASVRGQHHDCEERMVRMEGELSGYRRQVQEQSIRGFATVPASEMVHNAAQRVRDIAEKNND